MSLTLLQFAWMNCDDEANGGAPTKGEGQQGGGCSKAWDPPPSGSFHAQ